MSFPPLSVLIPHSGAMSLLDSVLSHEPEQTLCEVTITPDSTFFDKNQQAVPNWIATEYMAQCMAVHGGLQAQNQDRPIYQGFLVGSRKITFHCKNFPSGQTLQIQARHLRGEVGFVSFQCSVYDQDQILAEGTLNVFLSEADKLPGGASHE